MTPTNMPFRIAAMTLVSCLSILMTGCHKKAETNLVAAPTNSEVAELTMQVRRYAFEKRRLPQNLDELVAAGYIKAVPPAPAGKKFAVDANRAEAIMVNQ